MMKKRTRRSVKASKPRRIASQFFDVVIHDNSMAPTIVRGDHVTIDTKVNSFNKLCEGIYLVKCKSSPKDWELARPVPYMKDGRILDVLGIRRDNVGGIEMRDPKTITIIGRALIIKRQIDRAVAP